MTVAIVVLAAIIVAQQILMYLNAKEYHRRLVGILAFNQQREDALLDRVSTEPRLEIRPAEPELTIDPDVRRYVPDTPDGDEAWNNLRKVPEDER